MSRMLHPYLKELMQNAAMPGRLSFETGLPVRQRHLQNFHHLPCHRETELMIGYCRSKKSWQKQSLKSSSEILESIRLRFSRSPNSKTPSPFLILAPARPLLLSCCYDLYVSFQFADVDTILTKPRSPIRSSRIDSMTKHHASPSSSSTKSYWFFSNTLSCKQI